MAHNELMRTAPSKQHFRLRTSQASDATAVQELLVQRQELQSAAAATRAEVAALWDACEEASAQEQSLRRQLNALKVSQTFYRGPMWLTLPRHNCLAQADPQGLIRVHQSVCVQQIAACQARPTGTSAVQP